MPNKVSFFGHHFGKKDKPTSEEKLEIFGKFVM